MTRPRRARTRPPRLTRALLRCALHAEDREGLLGDLEEEMRDLVEAGESLRAARSGYRRQALRSLWPGLARRFLDSRAPRRRPERKAPAAVSRLFEQGGDSLMWSVWQDLVYASRMLRRNPALAAAVLLTLALGIGANAAVFSLVNGILLRPLPFPETDRLQLIWQGREDGRRFWLSAPNYGDLRDRAVTFADIAAMSPDSFIVSGADEPERATGAEVTTNFFDVVGIAAREGRTLLPGDDGAAVISHGFWQRQFGGSAEAVGRTLTIDGRSYEIVGVAAEGGELPEGSEVWISTDFSIPEWRARRGIGWLLGVGRLAPGATPDEARAELRVLSEALAEAYPDTNDRTIFLPQPLLDSIIDDVRTPLLAMMGAVGLVLLMACTNVAGLLLAWAQDRHHEVAIRGALGGGRWRIARQFLVESLAVAALGGALGIAAGSLFLRVLVAMAPPGTPRLAEAGLDGATLAFCAGLTLASGIVFGLAPALRASRVQRAGANVRSASAGPGGVRLRGGMVAGQVALAVVLVIASSLLVKSLWQLGRVDPGFDIDGLLTVGLPLIEREYDDLAARRQYYERVLGEVEALPGVDGAAMINALPLRDTGPTFSFELRQPPDADEELLAGFRSATSDYFETLGIDIVEGRTFAASEDAGGPPAIIIDETMAGRYFPGRSAVGQEVRLLGEWRTVVGVAAAIRDISLEQEAGGRMYVPLGQSPRNSMVLVVRTAGDPMSQLPAVRQAIRRLDPQQALTLPMTMGGWLSRSLAPPVFTTSVLAFFGASSLLLATIGLYGLLAYTVGRRQREIGVRIAVGARNTDVRRLVVGQGLKLTAIGLGVGLLAALAASRVLRSLLYEVSAHDPFIFVSVPLLLATVALAATWLPARRASHVDPMVALRID